MYVCMYILRIRTFFDHFVIDSFCYLNRAKILSLLSTLRRNSHARVLILNIFIVILVYLLGYLLILYPFWYILVYCTKKIWQPCSAAEIFTFD
jgi:hypothetical protein